jgi:hypothetical protein
MKRGIVLGKFIKDGTPLSPEERNKLNEHHKLFFQNRGINFISIYGT